LGGQQYNARTLNQPRRKTAPAHVRIQLLALLFGQRNYWRDTHESGSSIVWTWPDQ
jgi:hypothetical protein